MSGTFSSALQAKKMYEEKHPLSKIIVVDSRSAGPELTIVAHGIEQMLKGNIRFVDLEGAIAEFRMHTHLLFVLQSLHNLSLNGRVAPAVAKIAGLLKINLIGTASKEGKLEPLTKARGMKKHCAKSSNTCKKTIIMAVKSLLTTVKMKRMLRLLKKRFWQNIQTLRLKLDQCAVFAASMLKRAG